MPFELAWEPRGVVRRYHGAVTIEERQRSFDLICGDPRFESLRWSITSYLDVDEYEITPEATEVIAAFHIAPLLTNPDIVVAAVVVDRRIVAAIEHFISLKLMTQPYRIFATLAEARDWVSQAQHTPDQPPLRWRP